jgi:hypothetical protein
MLAFARTPVETKPGIIVERADGSLGQSPIVGLRTDRNDGGPMSTFYTDGQRAVQDQLQTTQMADLLHQVIVHAEVQDAERAFMRAITRPLASRTEATVLA